MMLGWLFYQICGVMLLVSLEVLLAHHCTLEQLAVCRKERDEHIMNVTNSSMVQFSLFQMPVHLLEIYCSYFNSTIKACYEDVRQHCTEEVQANFIGYEDSVSYLCTENYQGFLIAKSCLSEQETSYGLAICTAQYEYTLQEIKPNTKDSIAHHCSATYELQRCHTTVVTARCGAAAADWFTTFNHKKFQPELDYKKCDVPTTTTTSTTTITSTASTSTTSEITSPTVPTTNSSQASIGSVGSSDNTNGMKGWLIAVIVVGILVVVAVIVITAVICIYRHSSDTTEGQPQQQHGDITQVVINIGPESYRDPTHPHSHRHGSSGSIHNSERYHHGSSHSHRYEQSRYPDDRYARKDYHKRKLKAKDIPSEYLGPVRYTATPKNSFSEQLPQVNHDNRNKKSGGRSLTRYPNDEGSHYTELTHTRDTAPSVTGFDNNAYDELPN